jgi:hypothetical protein
VAGTGASTDTIDPESMTIVPFSIMRSVVTTDAFFKIKLTAGIPI